MKRLLVSFTVLMSAVGIAHAQNWPQFRGPGATGVTEGLAKPVKFDVATSQNVRWKTAIPGFSHASPVVWGNKVFVETAASAGKDETRFGIFGDIAPAKDNPKHTSKIYTL